MSGPGTPARRSRKEWVIRLLVVAALTYLGGVGISFAFGRPDPWSAGLLPLAIVLGSAVSGAWIRRAGRGT